jgi:hypothetical protein
MDGTKQSPKIYNGSGTTIVSGNTILGGVGLIDCTKGDYISRIYSNLTPHYTIRIKIALYFLQYVSSGTIFIYVDGISKPYSPFNDKTTFSTDANAGAFYELYVDDLFTHSSSTATINITSSTLSSFGFR